MPPREGDYGAAPFLGSGAFDPRAIEALGRGFDERKLRDDFNTAVASAMQMKRYASTSAFLYVDLCPVLPSTESDKLTSEAKAFTMTPDYTEVGRIIVQRMHAEGLIESLLGQLAAAMRMNGTVVIDGFYDTESGHPAVMAKVRTTVEQSREVLSQIDEFQLGDWWWENSETESYDLILSVGA